jgi:DNA-binding LytR/AlgR family response regulator
MNTIIIQKDPVFRAQLKKFVRAHAHLHLIDTFDTVLAAYQILFSRRIDLILLDSGAPVMPNIDFSIGIQKRPLIVFFHPNDDFIIKTDNCIVVDLLPNNTDTYTLEKTISKAYNHFERQKAERGEIFIQVRNQLVAINQSDIIYIKSMQNYVQIVTMTETYIQLIPLKNFHSQLSPLKFIQINRALIVNILMIQQINRDTLQILNTEFPIGEKYKANFKKILRGNAMLIKK